MPPPTPLSGASWEVRARATHSSASGEPFGEGETIVSRLTMGPEGMIREDFKLAEWTDERRAGSLFHWKTVFRTPPPRKEAPFKEEDAEERLREFTAANDPALANTIWFLAVLLERKRRLVERGVQRDADGRKIRIYEEKEGGETYFVIDPELSPEKIGELQNEVALRLGWKQPAPTQAPTPPSAEARP